MEEKKRPLGVIIAGGFNFFIRGILFFILSFFIYWNLSPQNLELFKRTISERGIALEITPQQFKIAIISQIIISLVFAVSGLGLLLKKEWARKLTLYFCFALVFLAFFSALLHPPLIKQALLQIIYPGVLIIYFTNKKVEEYFKS